MKFALAKQVLLEGLNKVVGVVSTRPSMPILSNVLLDVTDGKLTLTTTNMEITIVTTVECQSVATPGAITLPAKKFHSIINAMHDGEVSIESVGNAVSISCNRAHFRLNGLPANEFPPLPEPREAREFKIPQATLARGIRLTEFAISNDNSRYVLNGIYTIFDDGKLSLVATDGRRLALFETELDFPGDQPSTCDIPSRSVAEIHRLLGEKGDVIMQLSSNQASFRFEDTYLVTKLIDGNYPNYRQVIPSHYNERIRMSAQDLSETVRRVSLLSPGGTSCNVTFQLSPGTIEVKSASAELGEANESMPIDYNGRELSITFNADFITSALKAVGNQDMVLDLIDQTSPGLIRVDNEFLYVIMPMHA